jgi:CHAT domain-containing protein/tetratricopeptide (TPR) repeat protein
MNKIEKRLPQWFLLIVLCVASLCECRLAFAQCPDSRALWDRLIQIEGTPDAVLVKPRKLKEVLLLEKQFKDCHLTPDSVYARILHRIGMLQYYATGELDKAIRNTHQSIAINTSGKTGACPRFAANSYLNLGYYFSALLFYDEAIRYLDSAALLADKFPGQEAILLRARQIRSNLYSKKGDYQKCEEEATRGLQRAEALTDTAFMIRLLDQRAFAYARQGMYPAAAADASRAFILSTLTRDNGGKAASIKVRAVIMEATGKYPEAMRLYKETIRWRTIADDPAFLAEDYLDAGNLLLYKMSRYQEALPYFEQVVHISMPGKDLNTVASVYNDLGSYHYFKGNYTQALGCYRQAMEYLTIQDGPDGLENPASAELSRFQNKQILLQLFGNKTECLLHLYQQNGQHAYLAACLRTALLTDSLISSMRHEQSGEQSKLYWRDHTRELFSNALEACWLAKDTRLAFYFMEKSRAVLLNDKLNELGSFAFLPPAAAGREQSLRINIIAQQQALAQMSADSPGYSLLQAKLLQAKDEQERYLKSLEQAAPAYYQYKYADEVPPIDSFQRYLAGNNQTFVHYFINDTVLYMLAISPRGARLTKLLHPNSRNEMEDMVRMCADKQYLNAHYSTFIGVSHRIYGFLFELLQMPKGRIVICPDDFLIPFEVLSSDPAGNHFLLYDHTFSYVYSARYLMKPGILHPSPKGNEQRGNFLGIAPASFAGYLHVPDLNQSVPSIYKAASSYPSPKLVTGKDASRKNFLQEGFNYSIVNIYSHARVDSGDNEPLLFMSDSVIHLSELQFLPNPSAQLVVLSACQTGAGKSAAGEGIYSLARGFASAGIPAVVSTIWKADEQSIYRMTEDFDRNLSGGMAKDEALRQSKLALIRDNGNSKLLPYFWANMVLVGDPGPVRLIRSNHPEVLMSGLVALALVCMIIYWIWRRPARAANHLRSTIK